MWFKKQKMKMYTITPPTALGYTTDLTLKLVEGFEAPVAQINAWIRFGNIINGANEVANRVAGEQIRKQAAEIEGLTRELTERREWEAKIKEEYDALEKQRARDLELKLHFMGKISLLEGKLEEASVDFEKDDALFDEAADEIERLSDEVARLEEALTRSKAAHQKADGLFHEAFDANKQMKAEVEALRSQLAAAVSRYVLSEDRACTCKPKKGKAK